MLGGAREEGGMLGGAREEAGRDARRSLRGGGEGC